MKGKESMTIEYSSNNSGGSWWLSDKDWKNLEKAGWKVDWHRDKKDTFSKGERWLGALAMSATREGLSMEDAISEWATVTNLDPDAEGCNCCGRPHYFSEDE